MKFKFYIFGIYLLLLQTAYSLEIFPPDTIISKQSQSLKTNETPSNADILHRARELANNHQYQQALEVYNEFIKENPDNLDILLARGRVYAWMGNYKKAETDLLSVTQRNPDYGDAWSALGHLYLWWSKPIKAVDALSFCINLIPDNPELFISRAKAHLASNDLQLAENDLEKAHTLGGDTELILRIRKNIDDYNSNATKRKSFELLRKADSLFTLTLYDSASSLYEQIVEIDSTVYSANFKCAQCYSRMGDYENAIKYYSNIITSDSTDADARLERGRILTWIKKYKLAENDLVYVTSHYPLYSDAWSALGKLYIWQGLSNDAINVYLKWINIDSMNYDPYLSLAEIYRQLRSYPLARENLLIARNLDAPKKLINKKLRNLNRNASPAQWEMRNLYEFQHVGEKQPNWHQFSSEIKREMHWGSIVIDYFRASRFNKWDDALVLETYFDSWTRSYVNFRFQTAFNANILPFTDSNLEIFQGFGNGWEGSGSYRYLGYFKNEIQTWGISFAKYMGDWFLHEKTNIFSGKKSQGYTQTFLFRRYLGVVDHYLEVRVGGGKTIALVGLGPKIATRSTNFCTVSYQTFFNPDWGLSSTITYNEEDQLPVRVGLSIGLIRRW